MRYKTAVVACAESIKILKGQKLFFKSVSGIKVLIISLKLYKLSNNCNQILKYFFIVFNYKSKHTQNHSSLFLKLTKIKFKTFFFY